MFIAKHFALFHIMLPPNYFNLLSVMITLVCRVVQNLQATIGLCDVGGFEILPPGTAAQLKTKDEDKNKMLH
jgi:hypothetical protein